MLASASPPRSARFIPEGKARLAGALVACALTLVLAAPASGAQTINVTSTADTVDASPANGFCELPCTLRAAVQTANGAGSPGADTIMVPAGVYNRTIGGVDGADPAATGDLDVTGNLTITGAAQSTTTVDAKSFERGFDIAPGVTATISGLTVTGGLASDGASMTTTGGGIRVGATPGGAATLTVNDVTLRANSARYGAGVATEAAGANLTLNGVSVLDNIAAAGGSEGGGVNEFRGGTVAINNSLVKGNTSISGPGVTDDGGGNVAITDSTITENHAIGTVGHTGGVYETGGGNVTITRSTVSKNSAPEGGGVSEDGGGTVTIEDSTISENSATTGFATGGGVLRDAGGTVTIRGSTIAGNTAGSGGGIYNFGPSFGQTGTFEVSNTTISANWATTIGAQPAGTTGRGGGIHADRAGSLKLTNVTLRNNLADAGATEIDNCTGPPSCSGAPQTVTLRNTIVAGAGTNCAGPISSGGHNLDSAHSCALAGTGDVVDKDPVLGPLADNGGPTFTHAVLDGSPAIDKGDPATCPAADQRGVARGAKCDIGAFDRGAAPPQCSDGADNDGDSATDFPADQGCESADDDSESPDAPQCSDRLDNDGDGKTNYPADQGCESATDTSESPDAPQCSDRLDNDGDGKTNYPADQGCESPTDDSESPDAPDTRITSGPAGPTTDTTPTFGFVADPAAGASFECWMDAGNPAPCVSPFTAGSLAEGAHIFQVRARTPGGPVDGTPATRNIFIDTVAPSTTISISPRAGQGSRIGPGETYSGYVDIGRSVQDPEPSGGVTELRCAMDPPVAPVRGEDILGPSCPLITNAAGDHTVYAASIDAAGNVGPIAVARFRIQGPPETTITGGPQGKTWDTTPSFTFASDTVGATFQCRVDAGTWTPCASPFTTAEIAGRGGHFFQVAAIGPGGVVDPTAARRDFSVSSVETRTYGCRINPFRTGARIAGRNGCTVEPAGQPCSFTFDTCTAATLPCPIGARCTFKTRLTHADQDPDLVWSSEGYVSLNRPRQALSEGFSASDADLALAGCSTAESAQLCSGASGPVTVIGDGRPLYFICFSQGGFRVSNGKNGPDEARTLDCALTMEIRAADVLDTTTQGESLSVYVTQAGTLTAAPAGSARARISAAANKPKLRPLFRTTRKRAKRAGPVTFKLALSKAARKTLAKRKKLALTLRLTFKPKSGKTTKRTVKVTLRPPAKAPKLPKRP